MRKKLNTLMKTMIDYYEGDPKRIQHFIKLYHEAIAAHQLISVLQLALQSGFRSYSTFNAAFKQSMGMTATEWMRNAGTSES